jgi:phage portal protein BeeE
MRLLDRLGPQTRAALPVGDMATFLAQSWGGSKDVESVQATFASYAVDGYGGNGVVFACILARLQLFAQAEFKFQALADKRLYGTPALLPLERPWPGGTTAELLARMEQDVSLAGNAFVRRWPDRLERLRPDYIDIVHADLFEDGPDTVIGYIYWSDGRGMGENEFIPVEDVAHWSPIPDPLAEFRGMSWLTPVARDVNSDLMMTQHQMSYLANKGPNTVLKYSQKLGKDTVDALRERWQARYTGDNSWKTAVLDEGADLTVIGSTFEQMTFTALRSAGEGRIAIAAGVPPIVAGLAAGLDAATYSNYSQALKAFANGTMSFLWQSAAASLAKLVDVPAGARLWYDTAGIPALREAETLRAEAAHTWSLAAGELIRAGYEPQTVQNALTAGDMALLKHTGAVPTALYPDGVAPSPNGATP